MKLLLPAALLFDLRVVSAQTTAIRLRSSKNAIKGSTHKNSSNDNVVEAKSDWNDVEFGRILNVYGSGGLSMSPTASPTKSPTKRPTKNPTSPTSSTDILWYADWTSAVQTCKNDGNAPDYMVNNANAWMFKDRHDCCKSFFWYQMLTALDNLNLIAES
jgi:hypothetical protein